MTEPEKLLPVVAVVVAVVVVAVGAGYLVLAQGLSSDTRGGHQPALDQLAQAARRSNHAVYWLGGGFDIVGNVASAEVEVLVHQEISLPGDQGTPFVVAVTTEYGQGPGLVRPSNVIETRRLANGETVIVNLNARRLVTPGLRQAVHDNLQSYKG